MWSWSIALISVTCATSVLSSAAPPCTTDGAFFADDDCTKYWTCSNGIAYEFTCPSTLNFNPVSDVCDYVADAGCTGRGWDEQITEAPLIPPTPPPEDTTVEVPSSTASASTSTSTAAPTASSTTTTTTTAAPTTASTTTTTTTTTAPVPSTVSTTTTTTPAPTTPSAATSTSTAAPVTSTPAVEPSTPPVEPTSAHPYVPCWLYWWEPSCWNPQNGEPHH